MSRVIKAFCTYKCARCGRKESKSAAVSYRRGAYEVAYCSSPPEGWGRFTKVDANTDDDYCPGCVAKIHEVLTCPS